MYGVLSDSVFVFGTKPKWPYLRVDSYVGLTSMQVSAVYKNFHFGLQLLSFANVRYLFYIYVFSDVG